MWLSGSMRILWKLLWKVTGMLFKDAIVETLTTNRGVLEFDSDENFGTQVSVTPARIVTTSTSPIFTGYQVQLMPAVELRLTTMLVILQV